MTEQVERLRRDLAAAIRADDKRRARELKQQLDTLTRRETAVRPPEDVA